MAAARSRNVAVVGATGVAGQQFLDSLRDHPWFKVTDVAASSRSAGKTLREAPVDESGARRWYCAEEPDDDVLGLEVQDAMDLDPNSVDLVFAAIESDAAREIEPRLAKKVPVFSTASAFRREPDVAIAVPGVNLDQLSIVEAQRENRSWEGFIVPLPNCTTMGLVITLKPLSDAFGLDEVIVTSMQGLSGAGRSPGVGAMDILDNIIPYIPGEEEKIAWETGKILGAVESDGFRPHRAQVSATCTRANVSEGHTEAVTARLGRKAELAEIREVLDAFGNDFCATGLPSAPSSLIAIHDDPFRPQPKLDRDAGDGMTTSVGRLRIDDSGLRYLLVSHNTKMGAAKGAVLTAEYMANAGDL